MYDIPIPTRPQWQQLRDKAKVSKGAVGKVSIGDDLDAVHSTFKLTTLGKHQKALDKFLKDVDLYLAGIKKSHAAFVPVVEKDLKRKATSHKRMVDDLVKAQSEYYPRYKAVTDATNNLRFKNQGRPKDIAKAMERLLGCIAAFALVDKSWDPKRQGLNRMMGHCDGAATLDETEFATIEKVMISLKP